MYVGIDTRVYFSVADKTPQTFQIKITTLGGGIFVTPKITINKTCASIKTSYTKVFNYYAKAGQATAIELPFMNIGAKDGCGVNKMEVVNGNGVFSITKYKGFSGCPGALCRYAEVKLSKAGSFILYAKATLNDKSSLNMQKVVVNIKCSSSSAVLIKPTLKPVTIHIGQTYDYEFTPFKVTGIESCGFS